MERRGRQEMMPRHGEMHTQIERAKELIRINAKKVWKIGKHKLESEGKGKGYD